MFKFTKQAVLTTLTVGLFCSSASAALITYETRATDNGVDNTNYQASWNVQNTTVTTTNITEFTNIGGGSANNNTHRRLEIVFTVGSAFDDSSLNFEFGLDAGHGGAIYLNGTRVDYDTSNLWWNFNFNNTSEILSITDSTFIGEHKLEVYWAEDVNSGGQSARFSVDNEAYQALSVENLNQLAVAVPEPSALALLGLGIAGLGFTRRKKA